MWPAAIKKKVQQFGETFSEFWVLIEWVLEDLFEYESTQNILDVRLDERLMKI